MKPYKVTWEIDVEAQDVVDAARKARAAQHPETDALVFACTEQGKRRPVYVDLVEVGDDL